MPTSRSKNTCVVMTLCSRPGYTKTVLDALARCDDVDRFPIGLLCEPVSDEVISIAAQFTQLPHVKAFVMVGSQRVGCNVNTYSALAYGFDHHDRVIALEDDTVPGRDFLRFADWGLTQYEKDETVFSVCGYGDSVLHGIRYRGSREKLEPSRYGQLISGRVSALIHGFPSENLWKRAKVLVRSEKLITFAVRLKNLTA